MRNNEYVAITVRDNFSYALRRKGQTFAYRFKTHGKGVLQDRYEEEARPLQSSNLYRKNKLV